jgi:hypothetical protein
MARLAVSAVGRVASWRVMAASTRSSTAASVLTTTGSASGSCSACARRSAATVSGSAVASAQDDQLARAGEHVDADLTRDELLGGGDPAVPGADDDVDGGHGAGAVRQRGDGLGAADGSSASAPATAAAASVTWVGRGLATHTSSDAGDAGGDGGHQHAGRERVAAAGGVAAGAVDRGDRCGRRGRRGRGVERRSSAARWASAKARMRSAVRSGSFSNRRVYEPSGASCARAARRRDKVPRPPTSPKQVQVSWWQKPGGFWRTTKLHGVAVAVHLDAQQALLGAAGGALLPQAAAARPVRAGARSRACRSDSRLDQHKPRAVPRSSTTTVGHRPSGRSETSGAAKASARPKRPVYSAIPTCASAPSRIEGGDLLGGGDAPGEGACRAPFAAWIKGLDALHRRAAEAALALDEGDEEAGDQAARARPCGPRCGRPLRVRQPWVTTSPSHGVEGGESRAPWAAFAETLGRGGGAEDDLRAAPASSQRRAGGLVADAAADAAAPRSGTAPRIRWALEPCRWRRRGR